MLEMKNIALIKSFLENVLCLCGSGGGRSFKIPTPALRLGTILYSQVYQRYHFS